jgi:hypothetical protein
MKFGFSDAEHLDSSKKNLVNFYMGIGTKLHFTYTL